MPYHPHASFRNFLHDYLLMIDPMIHPVTMEPMYPSETIHRAANSPWRLCVPMRDDDWMQIAVPSPVKDHGLEPILGPAVRTVLERRCTVQDAETMVKADPWDGMILVPSRSDGDEHRIDALETASRIYAMGLAATGMID